MKKNIVFLLLTIILGACSSDQTPDVQQQVPHSYYVKYEVKDLTSLHLFRGNHGRKVIMFTTENGLKSISREPHQNWEATYGPFKKGTTVKLICPSGDWTALSARIYVSRDKEPPIIKAEQFETQNPPILSYTIDF